MIDIETFRKIALSFPESTEQPHFEKTSFRVRKKIFATLDISNNEACIKLSEIDQNVFSAFNCNIIFPVPNKWGKQGWTLINLNLVHKEMLLDAMNTAYCEVAPKHLALNIKAAED
ncbi:MmcQ/YjbR family DNA-binding protein [Pedobacter sp. P351]|uniref:MmcQ/YjbR family DNA-binding protein n=1 Tax=Pedobacter superstes TaxID=3133441 RepID=UPI0030A3109A